MIKRRRKYLLPYARQFEEERKVDFRSIDKIECVEFPCILGWVKMKYRFIIIGGCRISVRGDILRGVGLVAGRGAEPPDASELSKICKKVFRKLKEYIILGYFSKFFKTMRSIFAKHKGSGNLREIFQNFWQIFCQKKQQIRNFDFNS